MIPQCLAVLRHRRGVRERPRARGDDGGAPPVPGEGTSRRGSGGNMHSDCVGDLLSSSEDSVPAQSPISCALNRNRAAKRSRRNAPLPNAAERSSTGKPPSPTGGAANMWPASCTTATFPSFVTGTVCGRTIIRQKCCTWAMAVAAHPHCESDQRMDLSQN